MIEESPCMFCNESLPECDPRDICEEHFCCNWCGNKPQEHDKGCPFEHDSNDNWRAYL